MQIYCVPFPRALRDIIRASLTKPPTWATHLLLDLKTGLISEANGSAYIELEKTKLTCGVYVYIYYFFAFEEGEHDGGIYSLLLLQDLISN